eukprot:Em0001g1650a
MADKALPDIEYKAKEILTIERFLSELTNPQVAFAVRQRQPKTLYDAVTCTMETESYLLRGAKDTRVAAVTLLARPESASVPEEETLRRQMLHSLSLKMEKLEKQWNVVRYLAYSPACLHFVSAIVMETQRKFMVDTGAAVSLLSSKMWRAMGGKNAVISVGWKTVGWCGGSPVMVLGVCTLQLRFVDLVLQADFVVADLLQIPTEVALLETLSIPPFSEVMTMASCTPATDHRTWLIEGSLANLPISDCWGISHLNTRVEGLMVAPVGETVPSSREDAPDVSTRKSIMLQEMVERSASDLTPNEEEKLHQLLLQ